MKTFDDWHNGKLIIKHFIQCENHNCGCRVLSDYSEEDAIEKWNTRAEEC